MIEPHSPKRKLKYKDPMLQPAEMNSLCPSPSPFPIPHHQSQSQNTLTRKLVFYSDQPLSTTALHYKKVQSKIHYISALFYSLSANACFPSLTRFCTCHAMPCHYMSCGPQPNILYPNLFPSIYSSSSIPSHSSMLDPRFLIQLYTSALANNPHADDAGFLNFV